MKYRKAGGVTVTAACVVCARAKNEKKVTGKPPKIPSSLIPGNNPRIDSSTEQQKTQKILKLNTYIEFLLFFLLGLGYHISIRRVLGPFKDAESATR